MAAASNVVTMPVQPAKSLKQSERKFGTAVMSHGLYVLPALLLRAQARLNLTSTQMVVLLQLLEFWWTADGSSHPSIRTIAERINLSTKQTQRTVDALVEKGMIAKTNRRLANGGKTSNRYTFDGLIKKLQAIEKDFEKARKAKLAAAKPGGLLANAD
ncbi:MAG: helix-turn-helix domain-containing protein [Proteobacteria bacterium]|nr:helix-turn-helix domain-containing protein [Pseudomonadota bacterium]